MRHTVLVVEDQWSMQELVRIVLNAAGYHVILAGDGTTGLSMAYAEHPDLIVVDTTLPDMQASDLLQGLRHDARTAKIPVILLASDTSGEALAPSLRAGISTYLRKPFHPSALRQKIDQLLTASRPKRAFRSRYNIQTIAC